MLQGGHRLITFLASPAASGVDFFRPQYGNRCKTKKNGIISVYAPRDGYVWGEFENCMNELSVLVSEATRVNMRIIIGGDFNLSLDVGRRGIYI